MTLRCSKQRFFPLKTLSTEEEDSAILHVSSPNLLETAKQPTESSDGSIGTKHQKCLRSNLVSAGPKTSEYVSRRPWASEFLGCTLTHWLEVDSISTYLVWNSKRLDFIWKTLVSLCVLFNCDSCYSCWEFHVVSDWICLTRFVFQVLKTRLARSSGSPPYAQKLLQGWVPAFQTFLCISVHVWWSVIRRGFCAQRWFDRTRCVQRLGGNTVPEHQRVSSEVTESVPSRVQQRRWTLFALFFTLFFTLSHVYKCEIERS